MQDGSSKSEEKEGNTEPEFELPAYDGGRMAGTEDAFETDAFLADKAAGLVRFGTLCNVTS